MEHSASILEALSVSPSGVTTPLNFMFTWYFCHVTYTHEQYIIIFSCFWNLYKWNHIDCFVLLWISMSVCFAWVYAAAAKLLQSCPTLRPHRRQPTRLPCPWDSPGKNTGVGCHFLLQCMKVKSESEVAQSCPTLSNSMDCSLPGSSIHAISRQEVGCHCLLRSWIPKVIYLISCKRRLWFSMRQRVCFHAQNYIEKLNKTCCLPG